MVSSVTISDELRRKIKKIAAELDTTQGEIVKQAIDILETSLLSINSHQIPEARVILQKAIESQKNIEWRKEIRDTLEKPGISIDDLRISKWNDMIEN